MSAPMVGLLGIGATILGGQKQVQGIEQQGEAQKAQFQYQAGVADINAQISKQNGDLARVQGEAQAAKYGLAAGQRAGQIKVAQASSGLDINSGSAAQVQKSNQIVTNMDLDTIRSNAVKTAYDYDVNAVGFENQSKLYQMGGDNALAASKISAEASMIGTASSVAGKWLQASQTGLFNFGSGGGGGSDFAAMSAAGVY